MKIIPPQAPTHAPDSLEWTLRARRSCREFSSVPVTPPQLAQLLWSAQGITGQQGQKATPSAGAQYPLQVHVIAARVEGLSTGLYRCADGGGELEAVNDGDLRPCLYSAALDEQPWVKQAAMIFAITADLEAMQSHFHAQPPEGERGERYAYLESGAMAQNLCLQATRLGLGAVIVGGFDDAAVSKCLGLAEGHRPTALICLGAKD